MPEGGWDGGRWLRWLHWGGRGQPYGDGDTRQRQEVSSHWRRNIPGTGSVRASGLEHPLLVPGHVVAAGPAGEKAEGRPLWALTAGGRFRVLSRGAT